ncbi:initiation factor 2 [Parathielavia hyrcaniae]|uniref:Translation initiation factor IF-2, mitochondrial n=1 Tax=Parathielavia hyrcaniae TaxID=113614 RepID=A0AAN6SYI8_9PEZI|nr:initiation factor 2 [Parathielavia hyrcaniae]
MMRRGIWQQKQKRPSACLLCRFSSGYRPYIRPAIRPSISAAGSISHSDFLLRRSSLTVGHSTRLYSVVAGRSGHGRIGSTPNPRTVGGVGESRALGNERLGKRTFSKGGLPSWATQQVPPSVSDDGLLPHERAAREKAAAQTPPPPPPPPLSRSPTRDTQPSATLDRLLPHERAARERAEARAQSSRSRGTRDGRVPSWMDTPARGLPGASDAGLLPHERAAGDRAMGRTQPPPARPADAQRASGVDAFQTTTGAEPAPRPPTQPRPAALHKSRTPAWASAPSWSDPPPQPAAINPEPGKPQQADPLAFLLPHERQAREKAAASTAAQRSSSLDTPMQQGTRSREDTGRDSQPPQTFRRQEFRRQEFQRLDKVWRSGTFEGRPQTQREHTPVLDEDAGVSSAIRRIRSHPRRDFRPEIPRASIPLAQTSADNGEWKNLARRERNLLPPSFSMFSPEPKLDPFLDSRSQSSQPKIEEDPLSVLEKSSSGRTQQAAESKSPVDQWALLERQVKEQAKIEKKQMAARDADTWDWADNYSDETRRLKVQRTARETSRDQNSDKEETGPETAPVSRRDANPWARDRRSDRFDRGPDRFDRRSDRFDREERPERRKKPRVYRRGQEEEDDDWDDDFHEKRRRKAERERQRQAARAAAGPTPISLPEYISVSNLAEAMGQKIDIFVRQLEELGFEDVGRDNILTGETAALVAQEYGFEPTVDAGEAEDLKPAPHAADPSSLPLRPPVVTIMGHVDHGKTTLLDYLRKSSIVSQEHGGITQHIGAFSVSLSTGKQITFLDTPGHAAFLSMRQRGANVTDMVILVVAADDSVMPQTLEALKHARAAKVPIIVAVNKVDKPEANVDRVRSDLAAHGVEIEEYGGDVQVVCVSGKTGQGMNDLEEAVLTLSEMLDIRAERDGLAEGWVLESTVKPIGRVATVLVKRGTLRPGDYIVAGCVHAKVRSLHNEAGVEVDEATPGTAVEVLGWKEAPVAGDQVLQAPDEGRAKSAVRYRQELKERGEIIGQMAQQEQDRRERERQREREKTLAEAENRGKKQARHADRHRHHHETPAEADGELPAADTTIYVTYLVKGDVHGSVEAVTAALLEQGNNEVRARVLVSAPGQITESDVEHAAVSGSAIVNFNNGVLPHVKRLAHEARVRIMDHNVIYHLVEEVKSQLADALPPIVIKKVVGEAEVLQVFNINIRGRKYKNIAGCRIGNGYVKRGSKARVIRGGENVYEGVIETLKHVKKDVDEMKKGSECGMSFADWDQLQEGDQIQMYEEITEKRKL